MENANVYFTLSTLIGLVAIFFFFKFLFGYCEEATDFDHMLWLFGVMTTLFLFSMGYAEQFREERDEYRHKYNKLLTERRPNIFFNN